MFAKNIRYLRKKKRMSQDELAEKLGYKSYSTVQKWEMGISEPVMGKAKLLSELFGYSIHELISVDLEKLESLPADQSANPDEKNPTIEKIVRILNKLPPAYQEKVLKLTDNLFKEYEETAHSDKMLRDYAKYAAKQTGSDWEKLFEKLKKARDDE